MKKVLSAVGVSSVLYLLPVVAFAAPGDFRAISQFIENLISFMNSFLVPLVFAIAFLVFLWGIFKAFILGGADESKRAEGRQLMLYAIIGFLLMVSIWGIVNLLQKGFGFSDRTIDTIPNAPRTGPR